MKDLISIKDLSTKEIEGIFSLTDKLKANKLKFAKALSGQTIALIFQKPSNRTRVSFEVGMFQLGGNSIYLSPGEINLGVRETIHDVAKTLSRYVQGIVLRTFGHENVLEMAKHADIPVINGLSDFSHPCQGLADIYTAKEKLKTLKGKTLTYLGDGNNVCNSLIFICSKVGMNINVATPKGYEPQAKGATLKLFNNPIDAAKDADVLYTDVWASMGQEKEAQERKKIFKDFQINSNLLKLAKKDCLVMHCLPAHRGEEITSDVIDSKNSVVFDEAENRMHVQKAVLIKLLGEVK
ncbi:MAG: ornithine carbamoyltransferase [Candidatus Omnitrophica bacterium]|nr:ornithine carbamoyltransferase [Candidatus Omnitrophota bacterium]